MLRHTLSISVLMRALARNALPRCAAARRLALAACPELRAALCFSPSRSALSTSCGQAPDARRPTPDACVLRARRQPLCSRVRAGLGTVPRHLVRGCHPHRVHGRHPDRVHGRHPHRVHGRHSHRVHGCATNIFRPSPTPRSRLRHRHRVHSRHPHRVHDCATDTGFTAVTRHRVSNAATPPTPRSRLPSTPRSRMQ